MCDLSDIPSGLSLRALCPQLHPDPPRLHPADSTLGQFHLGRLLLGSDVAALAWNRWLSPAVLKPAE